MRILVKKILPKGYGKVRVNFVFDAKYDVRHETRLVADGHLTNVPISSIFLEFFTQRF